MLLLSLRWSRGLAGHIVLARQADGICSLANATEHEDWIGGEDVGRRADILARIARSASLFWGSALHWPEIGSSGECLEDFA